MKVLFKAPQCDRAIWLELTPHKGYLHILQEVRRRRIRVTINSLEAKEIKETQKSLVPYLLGLDPYLIWAVNYFLCQDLNSEERVLFLIETYPDWGLNNIPISRICYWYEQQKHRSFLDRVFRTIL